MNNYVDFTNVSSLYNRSTPAFMNLIKPKKTFSSKLLSRNSLTSVNGLINGAQKIINIYDQAVPIITQIKPMFNNIKTTFKLARAFKKFSNEDSLEKAFDNLPDYEETKKDESNKNDENIETESEYVPFYPKN